MSDSSSHVTKLLQAIDRGESGASDELLPLVYDELRARAGKLMSLERRDHTLQRTALVHEVFLKLAGGELSFQSRAHFFKVAALAMRRILVDHARRSNLKRGGDRARVELDGLEIAGAPVRSRMDWLELDEALGDLEQILPRQHQVVMFRFFSGRTEAEIADLLQISEPTVRRDWAAARLWLYRRMHRKS